MPPGTYKISSALTIGSNTVLRGAGIGATVISQSSTTAHGLAGTDITGVTVSDMTVTGPSSGSGNGIHFTLSANANLSLIKLANLKVSHFGSHGVYCNGLIVSTLEGVDALLNGGDGFYLTAPTAATSVSLTGCYANQNTSYGYLLNKMQYCSLAGCAADSNGYGYYLSACHAVTLTGCGAESNTSDAFILSAGSGNTLAGCWVYANKHYGIHVTGAEKAASLIGCTENSPAAGAVNFIITDTGTSAVVMNETGVTADSYAAGTAYSIASTGGTVH
jgi:hypothetical protein